jgi:serine protease Do
MSHNRALPYIVGCLIGATVGLATLLAVVVTDTGGWGSRLLGARALAAVRSAAGSATTAATSPGLPAHFAVAQDGQQPAAASAQGDPIAGERRGAIVEATRKASPSVVSINVFQTQVYRVFPTPYDEWFNFYYPGVRQPRTAKRTVEGLGSGVIVDRRGYVLTNHHVVPGNAEILVNLSDGRRFGAELIGSSPDHDLAVLKIKDPPDDLPVASLGDSDTLDIAEWAIAIGSPFGYLLEDTNPTVTLGVVSALHRDIKAREGENQYLDMIQTDAAINPGNSGGALVNSRGEVVGINTFIISQSGGSIGIGFAVPINRGRWVMEEILKYGRIRPTFSGLNGVYLTNYAARERDIDPTEAGGFFVEQVDPDSPAADAGLRARDIVRKVDGVAISDPHLAYRQFYEARVGSVLELTVSRGSKSFETKLTLVEAPDANRSDGR